MPSTSRPYEPRRFQLEREIQLPRAQMWRVLANTDHLNRAIGLAPVVYESAAADASSRRASATVAGQHLKWREFPFEWVAEEKYSVLRVYEVGPLARFHGGSELSDIENSSATRLLIWAEITPANALGALIGPVMARSFMEKTARYCADAARAWSQNQAPEKLELPQPVISSPVDRAYLTQTLAHLRREFSSSDLVEKLGQWLQTRGDNEVARIRPFQLAAQWNASREEVLRLCLQATRCGLLNLSWNLMCPNCRVSKQDAATLADVQSQIHCDGCGVNYDLNFDRYVELRFRVHPSVRVASDQIYCISGPFLSPHILLQSYIGSGVSTLLTIPHSQSQLRLRVPGVNHVVDLDKSLNHGNSSDETLIYGENGWEKNRVTHAPRLRIENRSGREIWVALEKTEWDADAATASLVTAMPEFRRWFGSEVLAPGNHVAIENLTLFFSDLRDSTQLYENAGDAPAYGRVRQHFNFLFSHIEANEGAVVKTIGDAVMAVFHSPQSALRASLAIQNEVGSFNASLPPGENLRLKIGLHHGPAIAVNSNDSLDYFGRVVNIASRIGEVSVGDDIVLSDECFAHPSVQTLLVELGLQTQEIQARLKGLEELFLLHRVEIARA